MTKQERIQNNLNMAFKINNDLIKNIKEYKLLPKTIKEIFTNQALDLQEILIRMDYLINE